MSGCPTPKVQGRIQISPFGEIATCRDIHTVFRLHDTGHRKEHKTTMKTGKEKRRNAVQDRCEDGIMYWY